MKKMKWGIRAELVLLTAVVCACLLKELRMKEAAGNNQAYHEADENGEAIEVSADGNYIKWVDFNITSEALGKAYELDVESYQDEVHVNWIELLAYVGAKGGGKFGKGSIAQIQEAADKLRSGETTIEKLTKGMEYYDYYYEAYSAVLGGMVGEFSIEAGKDGAGEAQWRDEYGLKAFSPIAKGFEYSHYDDFGSSRSYGYARPHLGHDMMGQIGTPIRIQYRICVSKTNMQAVFL
ncbi:MAG: hypothetical protein NC231_11000 [Bacillus sp. (in: Bacteria)]|nr:hypothetical protein [Bacillus sp. (in: firmicutes)]MCM1427322.1 hypothetical protein [Eubacterium sp.]